jgi:hypothetical protein
MVPQACRLDCSAKLRHVCSWPLQHLDTSPEHLLRSKVEQSSQVVGDGKEFVRLARGSHSCTLRLKNLCIPHYYCSQTCLPLSVLQKYVLLMHCGLNMYAENQLHVQIRKTTDVPPSLSNKKIVSIVYSTSTLCKRAASSSMSSSLSAAAQEWLRPVACCSCAAISQPTARLYRARASSRWRR